MGNLTTVFLLCMSAHQHMGMFQGTSHVNVWSREICLLAPAFVILNTKPCDVVVMILTVWYDAQMTKRGGVWLVSERRVKEYDVSAQLTAQHAAGVQPAGRFLAFPPFFPPENVLEGRGGRMCLTVSAEARTDVSSKEFFTSQSVCIIKLRFLDFETDVK